MAERKFRKKEDLFIKEKRRAKNFFITSSAKMSNDKNTKTTISSSTFTEMSKSFSDGEHLLDSHMLSTHRPILYMLQEMQADIDDVYNEVSASAFQASFFPFARIDSGSIGLIFGVIKETLPSAMFRVEVEIGGKSHEVLAHVSGKMRMHFIKILPGDVVTLEISPYDLTRGRITYRQK